MTIFELAKKAEVSIATVSRALNPHTRHKVKAETLEKIEELMRKHSYAPNLAAKNLRRTTFHVIGILVPHLRGVFMGDYYPKLLSGVSDALLESTYHFKMVMLKSENKKWDHYNFKFAEGVDGLIISHWPVFFSDKSVLNRLGIPCAIINDPEESVQAYFVSCDNEAGGRLAAEHLYHQGHRKIAVLTGPEWSGDSILRLKGFQSFLKTQGIKLDPDLIRCGGFQETGGYEQTEHLLKTGKSFSALFCLNDEMAFGAMKKLKEENLKCPENISIIGFDNQQRGAYSHPPLTTIEQPVYGLAVRAVQLLLSHLQKGTKNVLFRSEILPVQWVSRSSTASLKG